MPTKVDTVASRALSAGAWTVGTRMGVKLIDFGMLICLARFLGPAEFGLVAIAMAAVFVVEALLELPIAAALIRVPTLTNDMLCTAFTLSLLRGVVIALLLMAISLPLAKFADEPRLIKLIAVLSLAPALRGLVSPRMVEFSRSFNFRPDALIELSGKSVAFFVSFFIALATQSYWAIAAATVCAPLIATLLSYVVAPMRPRLTIKNWKDFSNLIGWNFVSQLFAALNWQLDRLFLPRFIGVSLFGQYAMGKQISEIPVQAVIAPLGRPAMAALSSAGESENSRYLQLSQAVTLILVPVLGFLVIWPEALIRLGLGANWLQAADWLRWISAVAFLALPAMLLGPLAMTLDRTRWLATKTVIELLVRAPLVWFGAARFGIPGAIAASAIATGCGTLISIFLVRGLIGAGVKSQLMTLCRPLVALLPAAATLWFLKAAVTDSLRLMQMVMEVVPLCGLYTVVYATSALLLWNLAGCPAGLERQLTLKAGNLCARFGLGRRASSVHKKSKLSGDAKI